MKRWARRNLPTVVLLAALILLAALVLAVAMPRETENTPVAAVTISPTFDEAAYQSRLEAEAFTEVEHETADIPGTYNLPEPPQEADSEPCGKGGFECQDKEDWERLAIVIYQEAGGDNVCDMCRYRVADVVLNRVADPRYPDTIEGVLMDNKYGLQWGLLSVTGIVWPDKASEPGEAAAVQRAWDIAADVLEGHHSDLDGNYIWCSEYKQGSEVIYCDGICFGVG